MQCLDDCTRRSRWSYYQEIICVGAYILIEVELFIDSVPHIRINLDGIQPSPLSTSARCLYYALPLNFKPYKAFTNSAMQPDRFFSTLQITTLENSTGHTWSIPSPT
jgi:hypothetical protein